MVVRRPRIEDARGRLVGGAARAGECNSRAHVYAPPWRNPWWAISSVSVNTLGESRFRDGPVQRTGTTPLRDHWATVLPSALFAEITAVIGCTLCSALVIQVVSFWLSGPTGRVSLMLLYFIRVGSCQTIMLLPPSSRCSSTTSRPKPSQLLNMPIDVLSSSTEKATPTGESSLAIGSPNHRCRFIKAPARSRSSHSSARNRAAIGSYSRPT